MSPKDGKSKIKTKNTSDNTVFELAFDHTLRKIKNAAASSLTKSLSIRRNNRKRDNSPVFTQNSEFEEEGEKKPYLGEMEIETTGQWEEPAQKYYKYPRFFVINNDGSAKELMSQTQLEYPSRTKKI